MRTFEQRIAYARENVKIQQDTLDIVRGTIQSQHDQRIGRRPGSQHAQRNASCGFGTGNRFAASTKRAMHVAGYPAGRLDAAARSRPDSDGAGGRGARHSGRLASPAADVRAAERRVAAQSEQIGIAQSDLYPHISIDGTLGGSAEKFSQLFTPGAFNSHISPTFRWDLLNYCRIANNVKFQDARFLELVATYQNTVLRANQEVEDGLVVFLRSQERTQFQQKSVDDAVAAVNVALLQYKAGTTDFTTVTQVQQVQVLQQDTLAQAQGEIVNGLIQVYRCSAAVGKFACKAARIACRGWLARCKRRNRRKSFSRRRRLSLKSS